MKITINKQIGKSKLVFETEGNKAIDALVAATAFTTMPDRCTKCGGDDVVLDSNKADNYTFIKVRCQNSSCRATSTMGTYKDQSGHFWKDFEIFQGGGVTAAPAPAKVAPATGGDDDLPF